MFAGLAAVCLIGLISRVLPHVWPTASSFFDDRLNYPLTYWNAEGMVAAMVLILGLHLCRRTATSTGACASSPPRCFPAVAATLLLTFSRGAIGAAVIGLVAYCLLARTARFATTLLALVADHRDRPALRVGRDAARQSSTRPAHTPSPRVTTWRSWSGSCMLGAGLLRAALLPVDRRLVDLALVRTPPRPDRCASAPARAPSSSSSRSHSQPAAGGFAAREYDNFVNHNAAPSASQTRERLTDPANDSRLPLWRAAVRIFDTQKLRGTGAGTYQQQLLPPPQPNRRTSPMPTRCTCRAWPSSASSASR